MVARRTDTIKRKRKEMCNSTLLDDSPKRTKVHAQRKFAQGSNVNSPVITPVKEIESERSPITVLPEPVELLPIKRPNTEDFLTFLCFRGTPILPPTLNFFNTASIVDTNGQVHEIKSESPKNGPIDIAKCAGSSSSSEKPFIAFGVRKRADPIVISRQMDRKRRHALALQALRRKYQEQKMAKIRALTISKLSEKVTNKTLVRTNSVSKSETVMKKTTQNTIQKTKVKVVATKHVKVTTHTLKTSLRAKIQPKMCLRSFRGRFVQRELPFRKDKKLQKNITNNKGKTIKSPSKDKSDSEYSTVDEDEEEDKSKKLDKSGKEDKPKNLLKKDVPKITKIISTPKSLESTSRVTRSGHLINTKINSARRQQIKKRILLNSPKAIVKPRSLRSTTLKKTQLLSQKNNFKTLTRSSKEIKTNIKSSKSISESPEVSPPNLRKSIDLKKQSNKSVEIKKEVNVKKINDKKEAKDVKKEVNKLVESTKKVNIALEKNKKETSSVKVIKNEDKVKNVKKVDVKSLKTATKIAEKSQVDDKKIIVKSKLKEEVNLRSKKEKQIKIEKVDIKSKKIVQKTAEKAVLNKLEEKVQPIMDKAKTNKNTLNETKSDPKKDDKPKKVVKKEVKKNSPIKSLEEKDTPSKKEPAMKKDVLPKKDSSTNKKEPQTKVEIKKESPLKKDSSPKKDVKEEVSQSIEKKRHQKKSIPAKTKPETLNENLSPKESPTRSARPSRKTKEAAAIYMELLSQKLVHERLDDEDNISIDSFPELPNAKRMEQRENELKAQAKSETKSKGESIALKAEDNKKVDKKKEDLKKTPENEIAEVVKIEIDDITITEVKLVKPNDTENEQKGKKVNVKRKSDDFNVHKEESKKPKLVVKTSEQKSKENTENVKKPNENQSLENSSKKKTNLLSKKNNNSCNEDDESDDSINLSKIKKQVLNKSLESQQKSVDSKNLKSKDQREKNLINKSKTSSRSKKSIEEKKNNKNDNSDVESIASSDINLKDLKDSTLKSKERNFSDSDEEPLSKLTIKSGEGENSQKSIDPKSVSKTRLSNKRLKLDLVPTESPSKPKRECAKRPQNYLMFSSSESEDDYFYGFEAKTEKKIAKMEFTEKVASDLLSKDISRRFGKEKVNMSNEQIEKWLKDSAMAGSSNIKADDELMKFGESIPTETTLDTVEVIDTQKLKNSLLSEEINLLKSKSPSTPTDEDKMKKLSPLDRKPIFRKTKKDSPNINAFSPENESSVYAFGEENEDMISTPFRRPSRRPSSTATSRSEDEQAGKDDKSKVPQFRPPPVKKEEDNEAEKCFVPPSAAQKKKDVKTKAKNIDGKADNLNEDFKYKVPSSPSASSSSSAKLYKRQSKGRSFEQTVPIFTQDFPQKSSASQLVEGPVFRPTDQEFQDPLEYIERIRKSAEQFGICKIIPPSSFKPECKIIDDMRFTAYNQYVHKMLHRWGPNFKELMAIKKYLETQNISLSHPPWIGGMEIDLPRLYQTVQTLGGLKEVIEKKKWPRVSECMKIPKSAQDRVTKLDDIYCKYLLPYDTLSTAEREKLFEKVETDWAKRESKSLLKAQQSNYDLDEESDESESEIEECITKGRNMALNAFYRIARNTMSMHFKTNEPSADEVEQEFWKHVKQRQNHICVHSGSIDSGNWGYGFAVSKNSPFARHAWNLKVLTNNSGSILRSMGPLMGVTVPTLHVGMVFSACCWYRDPHGLPWIEYLHTGGNKIWYGIPNSASDDFHNAMKKLVPNYCRNKELWLPSDTAMVPPDLLLENNVSLSRIVQNPGEFIVVFPKCFTSSISTGYVVSESVYFAPPYWLQNARDLFNDLRKSCEPSMFSLERLILSIATDARSNVEVLKLIIPLVQEICDKEKSLRERLKTFGNMELERLPLPEAPNARKRKKLQGDDGEYECETCRMNLFVSMVFDKNDDIVYCLEHAIEMLESKKIEANNCTLMFTYELTELDEIVPKIYQTIETKAQKKIPNKFAGMPTLLK